MTEWVKASVKDLVSNPDAVTVTVEEGVSVVVYSVTIADEDQELLGGRNNRLLRSLNSALGLAGVNSRMRHLVKIAS